MSTAEPIDHHGNHDGKKHGEHGGTSHPVMPKEWVEA